MYKDTRWSHNFSHWERHSKVVSDRGRTSNHLKSSLVSSRVALSKPSTTTTQLKANDQHASLLQLEVNSKRQLLRDSRKREEELIQTQQNLETQRSAKEQETYGHIHHLLRKYERVRGGTEKFNCGLDDELRKAENRLSEVRGRAESVISKILKEINEVDEVLKQKQSEVQNIRNFQKTALLTKDLQTFALENEIESIKAEQSKDISDLERMFDLEKEKRMKNTESIIHSIIEEVTLEAVSKVPCSVDEMGVGNIRLRKEIKILRDDLAHTQESIKASKLEIERLLRDPKMNVHQAMFPELCRTPRDESKEFDIPVRQWLPI